MPAEDFFGAGQSMPSVPLRLVVGHPPAVDPEVKGDPHSPEQGLDFFK